MKTFLSPYSIDECKVRLVQLSNNDTFGTIRVKVKFIPFGDGNYHYVMWKTMWGNFGQDTTLAETKGDLISRDTLATSITCASRIGRFYRMLFMLYVVVIIFCFISVMTSQKPEYLIQAGLVTSFIGFGWLLTYYWRNQLEEMIEHTLIPQTTKKKGLPRGKP